MFKVGDDLYKLTDPKVNYKIISETDIFYMLKVTYPLGIGSIHSIPKEDIHKYCGKLV